MIPEYINPVSGGTIATDFALGGALPFVGPAVKQIGGCLAIRGVCLPTPEYNITGVMFFGTRMHLVMSAASTGRLAREPMETRYTICGFKISHDGYPGLRNAGFNLLEIPGPLNTWMGGRLGREQVFRGMVTTLLTGKGIGSYAATLSLLNGADDENNSGSGRTGTQPNETVSSK